MHLLPIQKKHLELILNLPFYSKLIIVSMLYLEENASWINLIKDFLVYSDYAIFLINLFN
jgi:hypothetical protein